MKITIFATVKAKSYIADANHIVSKNTQQSIKSQNCILNEKLGRED